MGLEIATLVISPLVSAIVAGVVAALTARAKRSVSKDRAMERGMRALMREELIEYHTRVTARGECSYLEREHIEEVYKSYHDIGGNGSGTRLYEELMEVPVR